LIWKNKITTIESGTLHKGEIGLSRNYIKLRLSDMI